MVIFRIIESSREGVPGWAVAWSFPGEALKTCGFFHDQKEAEAEADRLAGLRGGVLEPG
jgi:hypothetical protein